MTENAQMHLQEFEKLLKSKKRVFVLTKHSAKRVRERSLPESLIKADIFENTPLKVVEQACETPGERKFSAYYLQIAGYFHHYIIVLNNEMRIITVMRTSKDLQKIVAGAKQ